MLDLIKYIWEAFCKPFKSRLFVIFFFFFFIPVGPFGIYYEWFGPNNTKEFLTFFTPKSIFTFTAPLMAAIIIEGLIILINQQKKLEDGTAEFELFRDCIIVAAIVMFVQCLLIYISISNNNIVSSLFSVLILWVFWIFINSTKDEFSPHKQWKPTGSADDTTSEAISNG